MDPGFSGFGPGGVRGHRDFDAGKGGSSGRDGCRGGRGGGGRGRGSGRVFDGGRGGGRGGSRDFGKSRDELDSVALPKQDFQDLIHFEKNFYVESPSVQAMSEQEVVFYRRSRDITVEGRDVPKPIRSFSEANFPGILRSWCLTVFHILREFSSLSCQFRPLFWVKIPFLCY